MKKLLTLLLSLLMFITLAACGGQKTKEVSSTAEFSSIGITTMKIPGEVISNIKYYIVDNKIAEIDFTNSGHDYVYRGSKECGPSAILDIDSVPTMTVSSTFDGISYTLSAYPEGLAAIWIDNMTTYSLFGKNLTVSSNYEFYRILELITDEDIIEQQVDLPEISAKTTKDYIVEWFKDNGFKDVEYVYENSDTVEEDHVIKLSKEGKAYPSDGIVCTISTGPKKPEIVKVADNMIGYTEADFVDELKKLGMGYTKGSTTYYSTTIKKGNVFDYDDGSFPVGTVIKYHLSRGAYEFDSDDFNTLTKAKAEELVDDLNKLNAHVELELEKHETSNHDAGTIYKCNGTRDGFKTIVSCRLAVSPTPDTRVTLPNYVGTYNNPCGSQSACTVNQINYMIEYHNDGNPEGYISAQTVAAGKVEPGTNVKLIVSGAKAYIGRVENGYYSKAEGSNYVETSESLKGPSFFGQFDKWNIEYENTFNDARPDGAIVEIDVYDENENRWNANYIEGYYSTVNTKVRVIINDLRLY